MDSNLKILLLEPPRTLESVHHHVQFTPQGAGKLHKYWKERSVNAEIINCILFKYTLVLRVNYFRGAVRVSAEY